MHYVRLLPCTLALVSLLTLFPSMAAARPQGTVSEFQYEPLSDVAPALYAAPEVDEALFAQNDVAPIELGDEYEEYGRGRGQPAGSVESSGFEVARTILLYVPNRILDFFDIFRVDVGIGSSTGVIVRLTEYGQVGLRSIHPASYRLGLQGRRPPLWVERNSEYGIGPAFERSPDRNVTQLEFGAGADILLVGAYLGISLDSVFDFVAGIVGVDLDNDDL